MLGRLGLKHDVTDSVCVAVVVSWLLWPHDHYSASESPPTPWMLKGWPTFTVRTVSINDDKRPGKKKKNGRRSALTLTSTSPPWRQFTLRSTGNEAHRGNTTWDVLSREKKNDLLVSALDIVHRTEMILLHPHLLRGNSVLTPPEAGVCVPGGVIQYKTHTTSNEIIFNFSF